MIFCKYSVTSKGRYLSYQHEEHGLGIWFLNHMSVVISTRVLYMSDPQFDNMTRGGDG